MSGITVHPQTLTRVTPPAWAADIDVDGGHLDYGLLVRFGGAAGYLLQHDEIVVHDREIFIIRQPARIDYDLPGPGSDSVVVNIEQARVLQFPAGSPLATVVGKLLAAFDAASVENSQ